MRALLAAILCATMLPAQVFASEAIIPSTEAIGEIPAYETPLDEADFGEVLTETAGAVSEEEFSEETVSDEEIAVISEDTDVPEEESPLTEAGDDTGIPYFDEPADSGDTMPG